MSTLKAYEEVVEFIAAGTSPSGVISFHPSEVVKERVAELIHKEKSGGISPEEQSELDRCLELEHLMRLAKARACMHLSGAPRSAGLLVAESATGKAPTQRIPYRVLGSCR